MSIGLQVTIHGAEEVERLFASLAQPDFAALLDEIGAEVEEQTQTRLADAKRDPTGTPWEEWSDRYASTRHGGHSLLQGDGSLLNSISYQVVGGLAVEIGSNKIYAAHHQFGSDKESGRGSGVPARPYLGISPDNRDAIEEVCNAFIDNLLSH